MRKKIILGLGMTLAFSVGVHAQEYKINKVGSDEQKSFDVLLNQKTVSEASAGSWLYVNPIVPNGKVFKGFTVYDQYGTSQSERKVSNTETKDLQFLMPDHDVYVTASYESLRYYLTVKNTDNGSVSLSFSDRYRDRTKPGVKVTVSPNAADGFKVASVSVSKYLDAKTTVTCTKVDTARAGMPGVDENAVDGRCTFEMPNFDVEVSAVFTAESAPEQKNGNNRFNVFYELNGGALPDAFTQSFSCDSTAKLPVPTKNGYDFIGWSLENKLDNVYYALDRLDGSSCVDKRVYAIWTEKGVCPEQKAIAVDGKLPQCTSNLKCALFHSNSANQDSVCNGVMWVAYVASVSSSSAVTLSSSSEDEDAVELFSSSDVAVASSSSKDEEAVELYSSSVDAASSSSVLASSSSVAPVSSSVAVSSSSSAAPVPASSSVDVASSSSAVQSSSSSESPKSSSAVASSSSAKPSSSSSEKASSSSAKPASSSAVKSSSSSAKPSSSSSQKASSSSSAKPVSSSSQKASSSSSAKPSSSSSKKASSSSAKPSSSSSEIVVEAVGTEEDMPSCTAKRENMTFYVTTLKTVFVCKSRMWTKFDPSLKLADVVLVPKFSAFVNGRSLQVSGARIGANVNLLDMQGRVIYNGRVNTTSFSMNVPRSGSYVLRVGAQQRIVNAR